MSMPIIERPDNPIDRDQSINDLIESVALMETGLSHIINAEGEKIQKVLEEDTGATIDEILRVNESVGSMVNSVSKLEMMLQNKLDITKELAEDGSVTPIMVRNQYLFACNTQNTDEEIISLPDGQMLRGFTADATNTMFTANVAGIYSFTYRLTYTNPAETSIQVNVNGVAVPASILDDELRQYTTSFIYALSAGDVISFVRGPLAFPVPTIDGVCAFLEVIRID